LFNGNLIKLFPYFCKISINQIPMKTIYTYLVGFLLLSQISFSQIGIGTTTPDATLDIKASNPVTPANNDGILIPKVDAFPVINPTIAQEGMLIFLRVASGTNLPGFYYWDGISSWIGITAGATKNWALLGNSGTSAATNFIGTTDDVDLVIRRNDVRAGFIGNPIAATATTVDRNNTSFGANSLLTPTTGYRNTAIGSNVLPSNSSGKINVAVGDKSMFRNTTGSENTAVGVGSLFNNILGTNNTAIGRNALTTSTASFNTAIGHSALLENTTGTGDLAVGNSTLFKNTTGNFNTANGSQALANNTTGNNNTALGFQTLAGAAPLSGANPNITTGNNNTAVGYQSFYNNLIGSNNVGLGNQAGFNELGSDKLYIENSNADANNALVYGEFTAGAKILRTNSTFQIGNPTVTGYSFPTTRPATPAGQVLQYNAAGALTFQTPATALNSYAWLTTGNSGMLAATNFIGTTDANPLVFRSSNTERMRIVQTTGEVVVGATVPFAGDKFSAYATGTQIAVNGYSTLGGIGVFGDNSGTGTGVFGQSTSTGAGVFGSNNSTGEGVFGFNSGTGVGVEGDSTSTGFGVFGFNNGTGTGVIGVATATTGANNGVRAQAASNNGFGLNTRNTNLTGTALIAVGNNSTGSFLTNGSGASIIGTTVGTISFGKTLASGIGSVSVGNNLTAGILTPASGAGAVGIGTQYGIMGFATTTVNTNPSNNNGANAANASAGGYFEVQNAGTAQTWAYVGVRDNAGTLRKIIGQGTVNTIVNNTEGKLVALSCPEAPENLFQDYGQGQLVNGKAHINIDPTLTKNIVVNQRHPLRVFIQLEGDCDGVFVSNKTQNGFDVTELKNGTSNVAFTYSIIANRADEINPDGTISKYSDERFPDAPGPQVKLVQETKQEDIKLQDKIDEKIKTKVFKNKNKFKK
jgi:hypothetical protein